MHRSAVCSVPGSYVDRPSCAGGCSGAFAREQCDLACVTAARLTSSTVQAFGDSRESAGAELQHSPRHLPASLVPISPHQRGAALHGAADGAASLQARRSPFSVGVDAATQAETFRLADVGALGDAGRSSSQQRQRRESGGTAISGELRLARSNRHKAPRALHCARRVSDGATEVRTRHRGNSALACGPQHPGHVDCAHFMSCARQGQRVEDT